jgi:hypothetical protein
MGKHEDTMFSGLKQAEATETNEDYMERGENNIDDSGETTDPDNDYTEPLVVSTAAKDIHEDTRYNILDRVMKNKQEAAEQAKKTMRTILSAVGAGNYESSSPLLSKIKTAARDTSLGTKVRRLLGRQ